MWKLSKFCKLVLKSNNFRYYSTTSQYQKNGDKYRQYRDSNLPQEKFAMNKTWEEWSEKKGKTRFVKEKVDKLLSPTE